MATADQIVAMAQAGVRGDAGQFTHVLRRVAAHARAKNHLTLARRLERLLPSEPSSADTTKPPTSMMLLPQAPVDGVVEMRTAQRSLADLVLEDDVVTACEEIIQEQRQVDDLREHGIEPRNRVMLVGPPGNGKTSLAEALAHGLDVPLCVVRFSGLFRSYLGSTGERVAKMFAEVRRYRCVLFVDEVDALLKERGDKHEEGELKRVVSTVLLEIDALPTHVVLVAATNHPEMLDHALWRRFDLQLELRAPTHARVVGWLQAFEQRWGRRLGIDPSALATRLGPVSFSDLEKFALDIQRRIILSPGRPSSDVATERLHQWKRRYRPDQQEGRSA